jgi:hypothetical protein
MEHGKDILGLALTGADAETAARYDTAVRLLQCYRGDPVALIEGVVAERPGFVMAHALRAWLHLLGTEPGGLSVARDAIEATRRLAATDRERGHLAAIEQVVEGRWHVAGQIMEDVTIAHPRDALGLLVGHQIDFFTGHSRMLRDRIARALPRWDAGMPGHHSVLGMFAFGLEETADYTRAEAAGRRAVELEPTDSWAHHAVAHVLEMQCRTAEGIAWMHSHDGWARDSFFQVHNWWHLALYHLEDGDIATVLALFDNQIYGAKSGVVFDMIDASALLWRLHLRGVDVGDRWTALADNWMPVATSGTYAFNDVHAVMALLGAGRTRDVQAVLAAQDAALARANDNAAFTAEVGRPVTQALIAFVEGAYPRAIALLRQIRSTAHRFGGSHAQRDLLDLTLIEAALRAGDAPLATALVAERSARRHDTPLSQLLARRARALT